MIQADINSAKKSLSTVGGTIQLEPANGLHSIVSQYNEGQDNVAWPFSKTTYLVLNLLDTTLHSLVTE